jgi:hypothetical protein
MLQSNPATAAKSETDYQLEVTCIDDWIYINHQGVT